MRCFLFAVCLVMMASSAHATEVKEVVSSGGFKAWLVEEHELPLIAAKLVFTGSGTAYDPPKLQGRASMTAALLTEGAGDLDSNAFNRALEDNAIEMHFALDEDMLRASFVSLSQNKEKAFSYLAMALTKPRFDDSAIERVRSQALSTLLQQEKDPSYVLNRQWETMIFPGHPYSNPAIGTHDSVEAMSKNALQDFTHRFLTRENLVIAVVGDITPAELSKLMDAQLALLPEKYSPDVSLPEVSLPVQSKQVAVASDIPQTMVMFGTAGVKRTDPDYYAAYVMNHILGGGGLSCKLVKEIREKRGLAYSASSQLQPLQHSGIWLGEFATRNEKVDEAMTVLRDTLKDYAQNGPTDKELADAKTYLTGSFVLGLDSNADIANYLIGMQIYHLGKDYLDKRNSMIMAVTKEQAKQAAKKLVDPEHLQVVMVGKAQSESKGGKDK